MKISFEEILGNKAWLHEEILSSVTSDIIEKASQDRFYDVKIVINGIEVEPVIFNKLVNNIEKYIEGEAEVIAESKLQDALSKAKKLEEIVSEACSKIRDEFNITEEE